MLSDDRYRSKLQQTTAAIKAWTGFVADVARIEEGPEGDGWRLALYPHAARACPLEILLRDAGRFDMAVGKDVFEDCQLQSLDGLLPLIEAVVEGRVIRREVRSALTGARRGAMTLIMIKDGETLSWGGQGLVVDSANDGDSLVVRDEHFLPYRRAGEPKSG